MKICVRGPLLSISGYGNHTRQIYRWLSEKNKFELSTQILPWGITPWYINPELENGLIGKIMAESISMDQNYGFDMSFQVQLPNEWDPNLAKFNVGVTAAVETDICNRGWLQNCNLMNLVVVPSTHTKKTLENSGSVTTPIIVVPEAFPDSILKEEVSSLNIEPRTSFNFLLFGQITGTNAFSDRKNTFFALKWLAEEFADDPDVGVIIKTNHGRNTTIDRQIVTNMLRKVKRELGVKIPIYLLHGAMNDDEIAGLYRHETIKALVAPTRGEGFGLPLLEAAASGLPVIATNWSGHTDFLNLGKWLKFDYALGDIPKEKIDGSIFVENSKWAEVKEKDFKKVVRKFKEKSSMPTQWASSLGEKLRQTHSFNAIASEWDDAMKLYME